MSAASKRRYRIVRIDELQPGDVIRTTRARVVDAAPSALRDHTSLMFSNGAHGIVRDDVRVGIYR